MKVKLISIILIAVLVVNLTLFVLRKITPYVFWLVVIIAALMAYKGIPYLKKK